MRCRGIGPEPCDFMGIAEAPGWQEDQAGIPLVGKTGDIVRGFMDGNDLPDFEDVFWTNLYREYHGKDYEYTQADFDKDEPELRAEFARVRPKVVITLGRHSTRYFLGDVDMEDVHAIAWEATYDGSNIVVFPLIHPAAGFHSPEIQKDVTYGFQQLAVFFAGGIQPRKLFDDPYEGKEDYGELTEDGGSGGGVGVAHGSRFGGLGGVNPALDTEGWPRRPWSLQLSYAPGTARLVRASHAPALRATLDLLRTQARAGGRITYHNSLHDLWVLQLLCRQAEVEWDPAEAPFDDTMVMAYLLQVEPKGLKSLGVRFNGMRMNSYESLVAEPARRIAYDYLSSLLDLEMLDEWERRIEAAEAELAAGRKIRTLPTVPKTALHKAIQRCLRSKDPRALWENQSEDIQVAGYRRLRGMPEATLDYVPPDKAIHYGCRDADCTKRLAPQLLHRIEAMGLREVYDLELSTYPLLLRMMQVGMKPDLEHFAALGEVLEAEIRKLQKQLEQETNWPAFNANSGDQVSEYLFERLKLPGGKLTTSKDRYSTNDKILEALEHEFGGSYPVIVDIRAYRELYKLKHTFVDRIPDFVHRWPHDGRIHTTLRTTSVVTGRLAASDPNLLAQPERGQWAWAFKRGWVAEEGHVVTNHDESQIELRVLAHLSQDPVMLAVYRGEKRNPDGSLIDLHASLAQRIFGVKPGEQDPDKHRYPAKSINFGLPMGMQAQGLTLELRKNGLLVTEEDAQRWIDETMRMYTGVPTFQNAMIAEARRNGYIRCMSGRIRYIGGIHSRDRVTRAEAERFAFSTPIQEGAQMIMKVAEASVWKDIIVPRKRRGQWIEPLLQVHDALKLEMARGLQDEVHRELVAAMTQTFRGLRVPLAVDGKWGESFGTMEKFT